MDFNDKIARASLHIEVADRVREMIFDRSLNPGQRIDELDLSAKLGTSRTPLREALKVLANEGLVRLAPGRGAFVTELEPQDVDSLFPVLAMLEGRCAAEAVRRQTPTDIRQLNALHQKMEEYVASGDIEGYHQTVEQLHHLLHTIAANPWLLRATTDLRRFLRLARARMSQPEGRLLQSLAEHRTLMKTIARGEAESAEQVMHHHLLAQQKHWRATELSLKQETPSEAAAPATAQTTQDQRSAEPGAPLQAAPPADLTGPDEPTVPEPPAAATGRVTTTVEPQSEAESIGV